MKPNRRPLPLLICLAVAFSVSLGFSTAAHAGGPMLVANGKAIKWPDNSLIPFSVDQGALGPFSNTSATQLVVDSFQVWQADENSVIRFQKTSAPLDRDVTGKNYNDFFNTLSDSVNPIIFDDDGSIVTLLYGRDSREDTLGFAGPVYEGNTITNGYAVFNGLFFEANNTTRNELVSTLIHEFGHLIGLDHSQQFTPLSRNGLIQDDMFIPIMYPLTADSDELRTQLTFDDQVALANLYPTASFKASTGKITGTVKRGTTELPGVNVIAYDVSNPLERSASTVTGTFNRNKGSYTVEGLPAGNYVVKVESIFSNFTSGSSVGQYAEDESGRSFKSPVRSEFYNKGDKSLEGRSAADLVSVQAGKTASLVDFSVESGSLADEEYITEVLPVGSTAYGPSMMDRTGSTFNDFLLYPTGGEKRLDIVIRYSVAGTYETQVLMEKTTGKFTEKRFTSTGSEQRIVVAAGGDLPLDSMRYFINVNTRIAFQVSVEQSGAPVATPTPTYTPTPSSTPTVPPAKPTNTPTKTKTPTKTPTRTKTPIAPSTATPTVTPTPIATPTPPAAVDLNGDGVLDSRDLFLFVGDWGQDKGDLQNASNLTHDATGVVSGSDLLILIEQYRLGQ